MSDKVYTSKYYTVDQIDERLLQGFYDDVKAKGYTGTYDQLKSDVISIASKASQAALESLKTTLTNQITDLQSQITALDKKSFGVKSS
jgi:hypothetical protein